MAGRPITLPEPWRSLALYHGGTLELCRRYHFSHHVLYGWVKKGYTPKAGNLHRLRAAFRDAKLPFPYA